ncbi:uncharacterized protein si:dkey-261l7.2 isoform X4 [Etheostoma spectabile]|nr:uncharacterized protein LOC116706658 isoform X4 [Etheostoma spectabile]
MGESVVYANKREVKGRHSVSRLNRSLRRNGWQIVGEKALDFNTRLLKIWKDWRTSHLNFTAWMDWADQQMSKVTSLMDFGQEVAPESLAIEAMIFDNDQEFFGASKAVRSPRPPYVFLRVGEVVMERKGYMVGVVVSWDSELRAPPQWVDRVYSSSEGPKERRRLIIKYYSTGLEPPRVRWILASDTTGARHWDEAGHSHLGELLHHFDGERFVMQPWLRELFPEDGMRRLMSEVCCVCVCV